MPSTISAPNARIPVEPLTQAAFAPFGTVIENPARARQPSKTAAPECVSANQGTALKYLDVTHMTSSYASAPSKQPAKPVMNMFVCSPRALRRDSPSITINPNNTSGSASGASRTETHLFPVTILERHPFTSQTFIPLGLPATDRTTRYLVIVAPTQPASKPVRSTRAPPYPTPAPTPKRSLHATFSRARPSPFTNDATPPALAPAPAPAPAPPASPASRPRPPNPKGAGPPDLRRARAFLASGSQAVTYGAGTWHAPMAVVGRRDVDFVVVQHANGVAAEDCQEVELRAAAAAAAEEGEAGIVVALGVEDGGVGPELRDVRARL